MAKTKKDKSKEDSGLPYFKFFTQPWLVGKIQFCSHSSQGLFINVCVLYWANKGELTLEQVEKKWPRKKKFLAELVSQDVVKVSSGKVIISFLDEQLTDFVSVSQQNRINAIEGWEQRKSDAVASIPQSDGIANAMPEDKIREEKEEIIQEESVHARVEYVEPPRTVIAETDFPDKNEIFEEIFSDARFMTDLKLVHPKKNIEKAWGECWIYHSQRPRPPAHTWEWKQKLSSWLTIMDEEKNGTTKTTTNRNINHVASVAEDFARRHGGKQGSGN